jgi:hypothetical protein
MRAKWEASFDDERARFGLRFGCEDCAHFESLDRRCRHGWPTGDHLSEGEVSHGRAAASAHALGLSRSGARDLVFCKEFELC